MFDLTNPSIDGTLNSTISSYPSPYASTAYRSFTSTPSSSFLFNIPNSIDEQQQHQHQQHQRLTEFVPYPNPPQDLM